MPGASGATGRARGASAVATTLSFGFDVVSTPSKRGRDSYHESPHDWSVLPNSSSSSAASQGDSPQRGAQEGTLWGGERRQGPGPSRGARSYVADSLGKVIMDSLKDIPYYKDGQDIVAFLRMFKERVTVSELSEAQKVTFLGTRLSATARGVLTSVGPMATLVEACNGLEQRLSRESAQALADKTDLSMYRQEKDEACFDFYLRYTAALSAQAVVLPDEELMLDLRNKLSVLTREKLALHTTGRALTMELLLSYLKAIDKELHPRTASVNVTKGYGGKSGKGAVAPPKFAGACHHCGKIGHRKVDCRSLAAGVPAMAFKPSGAGGKKAWSQGAPSASPSHGSKRGKVQGSWSGYRGRGRGRGGRGGHRGGGRGSSSSGEHGGQDYKHAKPTSSPPAGPAGRGSARGGAGASGNRGGRGGGVPAQALGLGLADEASAGVNGGVEGE